MTVNRLVGVITTIQPPTPSVKRLCETLRPHGAPLLVVGDEKGPATYDVDGAELLSLTDQLTLPFKLARLLPTSHYCRKNVGYLVAINRGATCIYETDDDNAPLPSWRPRLLTVKARRAALRPWVNVYRFYTDELIWPRGFPLQRARDSVPVARELEEPEAEMEAPVQQALTDGSPDADAIWHLILHRDIRFRDAPSVWLPRGSWCPFNSQSTWWWPTAYPLMYLPSYCSFRMTDIWRSFIAQRCMWEFDAGVVFHTAEVVHERNVHNLLRDFQDEVPGYIRNEDIVRALSDLELRPGVAYIPENMRLCYEQLSEMGVVANEELALLDAWLADVAAILRTTRTSK